MKLQRFKSIGHNEKVGVFNFLKKDAPLSGYLAGHDHGGECVRDLEDDWASTFRVKHAIAVNSATSGLLAAAFAIGLTSGDTFAVSAMTMSATAAAPMFTGARPFFCDVEDETFGIKDEVPHDAPVFVTNLFGAPAELERLRSDCDRRGTVLIEDNSQSPFAYVRSKYAGTIGHIGVFSLNVHKPIQCGEGGVIVTDDDLFADRMRAFINHGEVGGGAIGLNLRMTEVCAAIALVQLERGDRIVEERIEQAEAIRAAIPAYSIPGLRMPVETFGARSVYYTIPFLLDHNRTEFCAALRAEGVPIVEGYVAPLYRLPVFSKWARPCPMAESLHDRRLFYFENCAWDVTLEQAEQIGAAFEKAARMAL